MRAIGANSARHCARQAAEPAHDDDDEGVGQHLEIGAGVHAEETGADDPAESGQAGAEPEDGERDARDIDAHALRHLAVVHGGADHGARARPVQQEPEPEADGDGDADDEDAVQREHGAPHSQRARESGGHGQVVRIASPDQKRQVLEDQREADGHEHLPQVLAPQPAQEDALHGHPDQRDGHGGGQHRHREASRAKRHRQPKVAAQHEVGAVGHVHDAHDAEDQREPARQQEEQRAVRQPVERLYYPEVRAHAAPNAGAACGRRCRARLGAGPSG
jgi:hypothetical protein